MCLPGHCKGRHRRCDAFIVCALRIIIAKGKCVKLDVNFHKILQFSSSLYDIYGLGSKQSSHLLLSYTSFTKPSMFCIRIARNEIRNITGHACQSPHILISELWTKLLRSVISDQTGFISDCQKCKL